MPEGDVLLRVSRELDRALAGRELTRTELRWGGLGGIDLTGRVITRVQSWGKNTLIRIGDRTLRTHLKMDGTWRIHPAGPRRFPDPRIRVVLGNTEATCAGRLIGLVELFDTADTPRALARLGPDLLAGRPGAASPGPVDFAEIAARARGTATTIGSCLLDQRVAAGVGTIYLAESLWITRVHPLTPVLDLPPALVARIYETATALMARSADAAILTATGDTRPGMRTHVHGRARLGCRRCGTPIEVVTVGAVPYDRPGYFCPRCQPPHREPAAVPSTQRLRPGSTVTPGQHNAPPGTRSLSPGRGHGGAQSGV